MPSITRHTAAVIVALAAITCAGAQPPSDTLTLGEAVQAALTNNPEARAAAREVGAARLGLRSARALANPGVEFTPALSPAGSDVELLIRQPLEINGARAARSGIASAALRSAQARADATWRDLVYETRSAYAELARARELASLAQDLVGIAEESDRLTSRQVEVGTLPGLDRMQTGIEAVRARREALEAESRVTEAAAALNAAMGRPADSPVGALMPLATQAVMEVSAEDTERVVAARAEIAAALAERDGFLGEARLARVEARPDLAPQIRAESLTRRVEGVGVGLGVTLPLVDWGERRNRVRQAERSAEAQALRVEALRLEVRRDIARDTARLRAAEETVALYREGVLDQAARLLEAARTGVRAGQTSVLVLLDAQRAHQAVRIEYINALAERALAAAALEKALSVPPAARPDAIREPKGETP